VAGFNPGKFKTIQPAEQIHPDLVIESRVCGRGIRKSNYNSKNQIKNSDKKRPNKKRLSTEQLKTLDVTGGPSGPRTPNLLIKSQKNTIFTTFHKTSYEILNPLIYMRINVIFN
jgi:hypothetical protein